MITLKNVSKWYGHFQVLTDCSTEVKKGEVGVGWSALACLHMPTSSRRSFPAVSNNAWRSPARYVWTPLPCYSMNQLQRSIRK